MKKKQKLKIEIYKVEEKDYLNYYYPHFIIVFIWVIMLIIAKNNITARPKSFSSI